MKNEKLKILLVAGLFCILHFAFLIDVNAQMPAPSAPKSVLLPKPVEKTLPNGLRVIVAQTKNVPIVTAQLLTKSGGEADPEQLSGLADFTASLLTKGTKTRSASQIAEEIEFLGGGIGAGAGWDSSNVSVRVTNDKIDKALAVLSDVVMNPAFSQEEIDRYREQLLDGLNVQMKQPGAVANNVSNKLIFKGTNYSHPLGGTPESVQRIKQADLIKFHSDNYAAHNSVLVFTGDILPAQAFLLAAKYFGKLKSGSKYGDPMSSFAVSESKGFSITVVDLPDSGQAAVNYVQPSIKRSNPDYYVANVLNAVLGNGYSSRLNQEVRIKRGLSYGAGSSFGMRRSTGIFRMSTQTKNESAGEVSQLFVEELNKMATGNIPETELIPRKSVLTGGFSRNVATTDGLAGTIGGLAVYDLPLSNINSYIQNTNAVTANQIKGFASSGLNSQNGLMVIVGDAKKFMDDLKKRFPKTPIRVIPLNKLDLESDKLEK
ncbi:MAG TPA: pitrilysin family protein [Pyrinomonadaceae bacterium]|nr:pitrilysin family protein [Pyrinomonadaceae bacterium]